MKKYTMKAARMFLLIATLLSFTQCVQQETFHATIDRLLSHNVTEVKVPQAVAAKKTLFLDTRSPEEYEVSHIKNSRFINDNDFSVDKLNNIPRDTPIIVYCAVGYRSEKVTRKLVDAGFTNVANLYGGIFEWVNDGYPVVDNQGATNRVHAYNKNWGKWLTKGEKVY